MLKNLAGRTGDYPDVKARIEKHLMETQKQAEALEGCIKRRGGDTSTLKDMAGKVVAFGQGMSGIFVETAAEAAGDTQTKAVCERILQEELTMASDLERHLPDLTRRYLGRLRG